MMKQWRDVNTSIRVSVLARQVLKSVSGDLSQLTMSQRNMLAAIAIRDRNIAVEMAMYEFSVARSSIGFASTLLRFVKPQLIGLVLHGKISSHKLDDMRRKMGSSPLAVHLLGMTDEQIRDQYASRPLRTKLSKRSTKAQMAAAASTYDNLPDKTPLVEQTYMGNTTTLTPSQLKAQHAANVRWGNHDNTPIKGLPIVPLEAPSIVEWSTVSLNRALKVLTTARDLAEMGDIEGAHQLLKVAGRALTEA